MDHADPSPGAAAMHRQLGLTVTRLHTPPAQPLE